MNVDRLLSWPFVDVEQRYTARDTMFYALSVGAGADPCDEAQLRWVYERDLQALPGMAVVLGHPGPWAADPQAGIDVRRVVYAEQALTMHRPLAPAATVRARERVVAVSDKGADKGSLIVTERRLVDAADGAPLATLQATLMCRGDGGHGRQHGEITPAEPLPTREPDSVLHLATLPQQALLYRLNGDMNPLHADPQAARRVGFERPILHGLATFAFAVRAVLQTFADSDGARLAAFRARFSSPVYPGETLRFDLWREGDRVAVRGRVDARDVTVLDRGWASLNAPA